MAIPDDPQQAGWYSFGAKPTDQSGATVLAGHIDAPKIGSGPLARIVSLRKGDKVQVRTGDQTVRYAVLSVSRVPKVQLDLGRVFSRSGAPRLHLLTCGGPFDRATGHYRDNILVVARLVSA